MVFFCMMDKNILTLCKMKISFELSLLFVALTLLGKRLRLLESPHMDRGQCRGKATYETN